MVQQKKLSPENDSEISGFRLQNPKKRLSIYFVRKCEGIYCVRKNNSEKQRRLI